jgi:putative transposase
VLCRLFGNSRQAWYQYEKRQYQERIEVDILLEMVRSIRSKMPRLGTRKLLVKIDQRMRQENHINLSIGRDSMFKLLRDNGMLVRRKKMRIITTHSLQWMFKYPNLIKEMVILGPNKVWVCDITYIETNEGVMYLFLITDAYSHKIAGHCLADNMRAENGIIAMKSAIKTSSYPVEGLIHHSDRGTQYCCHDYVSLLEKNKIRISMTENGDVLENAMAERVNGILKTEWIYERTLKTKKEAGKYIAEIILIYNKERPHLSVDMLTPEQAHQRTGELKKHWKNYYLINKKKEEKMSG